ncbi:TetR/AcrR family transcriptional regulator [Rhodococcus tukisamuensis]|uniref:DNA-binding transcriptional regulator, AcrR family n=1 Tax=Rhodococcus tukisamuensis TaxID=168276 RepID=A0A1G6MVV9_9NOCA|nr:TetR/AcrR family transcriptional regulator [Rhodococcus tukisamuensis]SDC59693.1 DNA-binding transcriptional regulator, AcrR family [Rhodococcus tukisamuensis]
MSSPSKAGRPRSADLDRALLVATQDLLAEVGYDRLSIETVAARCGAGKATVYRRWAGKSELVADAVAQLHGEYPEPDTGTLRGDLLLMSSIWLDPDSRRDAVVAGLLTAMAHDAGLREAVRVAVSEPHQAIFAAIVGRAVARGEVPAGRDLEMIGSVFPAVTFHHLTVLAAPVGKELVERIIDGVLMPALTWHEPTTRG